jgi:hypothetical protein
MADFPNCVGKGLPPPPERVTVTLPLGISIEPLPSGSSVIATELSQIMSLMNQLSPALAALQPVLRIIDAVTALFAVLQKAPEIPVDPAGFFEALGEAAEKIGRLTPLIPQFSIPLTISSTIAVLSGYARAISDTLREAATAIAQAQATLDAAVAAGDAALEAQARCSLASANALKDHAAAAMGPLSSILDMVTGLMGFIPSPQELPTVPDASLAAEPLADALDAMADVLDAIRIPGT